MTTIKEHIESTLAQKKITLFMKGNRHAPQCGFSAHVVGILLKKGVDFQEFDILQDDFLRQGLKEYSNWPTFPQLYVSGKLIGGSDIVAGLEASGELDKVLAG